MAVHSYAADLGGFVSADAGNILVDDFGLGLADDLGGPLADDYGLILVDDFGFFIGAVVPATQFDVPRSTSNYAQAIANLLPHGPAWPRDENTTLMRVVRSLAGTWQRIELRAQDLLTESPAGNNLVEMLPEWEAALGLPDSCAGQLPTISLRQAAVRAHLAARGGQSVSYFISVAAALGVAVTVTEFAPSRFGRPFGGTFGGEAWAHTWRVTAPSLRAVSFQFGQGRFGDAFQTWGSQSLECVLNRIKPAHTILQFVYT